MSPAAQGRPRTSRPVGRSAPPNRTAIRKKNEAIAVRPPVTNPRTAAAVAIPGRSGPCGQVVEILGTFHSAAP
jgi:hypothetical protein